ncbi:MAG: Spy/CpxP family protein refolding chaperone [Verrucomicrobiia bacterium]
MRSWYITMAVAALLAANGVRAQGTNENVKPTLPQGERSAARARLADVLLAPRIADELSLTDTQKAKLKDLDTAFVKERDEWRAAHKEVGTEMQKLREEASAARKAGDNAKLEDTRKKMQGLSAPIMELRRKYMDQFRATLTNEQKQKLATALEQMQERWANPPPGTKGNPATTPAAPKPAE